MADPRVQVAHAIYYAKNMRDKKQSNTFHSVLKMGQTKKRLHWEPFHG